MSYIEVRCTCPTVWNSILPPPPCYYCSGRHWLDQLFQRRSSTTTFGTSTNPEYVGRHRKVA